MRLGTRLQKLEVLTPPRLYTTSVPDDPVAFARELLAGAFAGEDTDPTHPHHTGWLVHACAFLGTLEPAHQDWLRFERERNPRAYPDALLLPAPDDVILAALDQVMRRG